ncbi:YdeI/OmpD-associated family protein [Spirosoma aerophilum]
MEQPILTGTYTLEKFPGKGGWTYAAIPEILPDKHSYFGWVRVRGTIDGIELGSAKLMPMGNGILFLPVKAAFRKKIGKEAGDSIRLVLYADALPAELPDEFRLCLLDEPSAFQAFLSSAETEQKALIHWIYSAASEDVKIDRMAKTIDKLARQQTR